MRTIRLIAVLLLCSLLSAQEASEPEIGRSNTPEPKPPVVDHNACPGKDKIVPKVSVEQDATLHSSWQNVEESIGVLKAGERVTVIGGANVIRQPDTAVIKYVGADLPSSLKVGDAAFGYGVEADGNVVFWSHGRWFSEWIEAVAETGGCGFTAGFGQGGCTIDITKAGVSEWWVQVKTRTGLTGWVMAAKFNGEERRYSNFSGLCHYGED